MNNNDLAATREYDEIMGECRKIADCAHPGYRGLTDWLSNVDFHLRRIGVDTPSKAAGMVSDLHTRRDRYSAEFGFSPERVDYFANRLVDGILLSQDEQVIGPMVIEQALAVAHNTIAFLQERSADDALTGREKTSVTEAIATLHQLARESSKNDCTLVLQSAHDVVNDLFAITSTEADLRGVRVMNDLRVAMTFLTRGIGAARPYYPIIAVSSAMEGVSRAVHRTGRAQALPTLCLDAPR